MLPPPPTSRNSSYAYRPQPSPALDNVWQQSPGRPGPSSRTPSHVRHASYASASRHSRKGGDDDDFDEDDDVNVNGKDRTRRDRNRDRDSDIDSEAELDELREEIMGADDARTAGRGKVGQGRGLEETLEEIGFGAYHWRLLALCGFGWMSDNSALQCIAVILPRVQVHYNLSGEGAGLLSSATMAGMMVGAIGWGVLSDMLGRALPFNSTLFLTAVFGIGASFSPNFPILLGWMFLLGSAVGGSMPTDGTLFLENLPHSKQYLLTLLSIFFSLGAVLSSVISYFLLPGRSCQQFEGCDITGGANEGWRRVLLVLGLVNLACAFARWFLFRLRESPRYLVTHGRDQEAVVALKAIATFNENEIDITREDVAMDPQTSHMADVERAEGTMRVSKDLDSPLPPVNKDDVHERSSLPSYHSDRDAVAGSPTSDKSASGSRPSSRTQYDAVGLGPAPPPRKHAIRSGSSFYSASYESPVNVSDSNNNTNRFDASFARAGGSKAYEEVTEPPGDEENEALVGDGQTPRLQEKPQSSATSRDGISGKIVGWLVGWKRQMGKLFVPKWRKTVILMWIIWGSMSFSYTMFNVWLPAVLESRSEGEGDEVIRSALMKFVLYSVAGCPGSILGAWMIQTSLGRRKSLAICTIATSISTFIFIRVKSDTAVVISSMLISTAATAMYAVLYGMTPETFGTAIRGTACGTSAALSRLTGVMAPVSAGALLSISPSLPVFTSAAIFILTAACSLLLPFERIAEGGKGGAVMAH